jgi:putative ABC transport system permease protein
MNSQQQQPPRWATRFLHAYCRAELVEDLEGDLREYFDRNVKSRGLRRARWIYFIDVVKFCRPYTLRRPDLVNLFIQWIMLNSYAKTSARNVVRNKLFSGINIFGLAVSMSVALLVLAFVNDLTSYDSFQKKKDRIYRLNTHYTFPDGKTIHLASTSVKAGKSIQETMSGMERVVLMRNGFGGDATIGDKKLPIDGLWASEEFFQVFSFPLLQGNAATALREPYSLVLTEKSAKRLFGRTDVLGESVKMDTVNYLVTGVMRDVPKLSHMRFETLCSFSTAEAVMPAVDPNFLSWWSAWSNYVYILFPQSSDAVSWQANLDALTKREAGTDPKSAIELSLQPITDIVLGPDLSNQIGPSFPAVAVWVLAGLAFVIVISACFNYTNLSVARSLRRAREVGVRKVNGAQRSHVLTQFLTESVLISMLALCLAIPLFLFLRTQTFLLNEHITEIFALEWSPMLILYFIALAVGTGIVAGLLPAIFFSRMNAIQVLKNTATIKVFRHVSLRKSLIVVQYVTSLMFITTTFIGYRQYNNMISFDLGFTTKNIVNVRLKGNDPNVVVQELSKISQITDISRSLMITSIGSMHGSNMKYESTQDSVPVWINMVDEHYLPLHEHKLLAGTNFKLHPKKNEDSEVIVNEQVLKRFKLGDGSPHAALGQEVVIDKRHLTIIGVMKDFHYGTTMSAIEPTVFRYSAEEKYGYVNLKIASHDASATMSAIRAAWEKIDKVHELDATFYDDQIQRAYDQFLVMAKVIGVVSFLAICISSLGLFGMVVFTTETRMKEVGIRKVLGAREFSLVALLSRGFLILMGVSAAIALPATYLLFDKVILTSFVYREPIGVWDMTGGALIIALLAILMIGIQTWKAARTNPAAVLKSE